ncbi:MAG: LPS export ABC transporter permease LptG [Ramlibacter sp.]|jgi:lipopolysaccharide export system permease protein|nr:LPS export ABC transporter permease LptG [Ramlibacter sp.]MBP9064066.1 LPS export ABC transporter permease LptG [Aquabacterium sp.]
MKTLRSLLYGEVLVAVAFVTLGFVALFFFFDFVEELRWIGSGAAADGNGTYRLTHALAYVGLLVPSHLYELLPITVLIGAIYVMARMAQTSEFTILRTSGLGPWRALRMLLGLGLSFTLLTFAIGDYLAPLSDRSAQLLKARFQGRITTGATGAWLKEKQATSDFAANVAAFSPEGDMREVRVFEFDAQGYLISVMQAPAARFATDGAWELENAERREFDVRASEGARVTRTQHERYRWVNGISREMVSTALLKPERMGTFDLFRYIQHLDANGQTAQRYEIEFWRKVFYPLSCLVMVVLALPFAYLHFRAAGITAYVFAGVMIGISFFLLNNVFGYIGNINNWEPWIAASAPGLLYSLLSLAAFGWLVLRQ